MLYLSNNDETNSTIYGSTKPSSITESMISPKYYL